MAKKKVRKSFKYSGSLNRLHVLALFVMALGAIFVTVQSNRQVELASPSSRVMERFVVMKMYTIIEERNAVMRRGASQLKIRETDEMAPFLVDGDNKTLYRFVNDEGDQSTCYDDCADKWPAMWAKGDFFLDKALTGDLGVATRTDGPGQVLYDGIPLYYFAGDLEPGDINGHGIKDKWFVVTP